MRVAITGGTGSVGRHLARGLVARGYERCWWCGARMGADESILQVNRAERSRPPRGEVIGKHPLYVPMPLAMQRVIAWVAERTMKIPLLSLAQLRIVSEGVAEALPAGDTLPADLLPATRFTAEQIQNGLPEPGPFGLRDLRCCKA